VEGNSVVESNCHVREKPVPAGIVCGRRKSACTVFGLLLDLYLSLSFGLDVALSSAFSPRVRALHRKSPYLSIAVHFLHDGVAHSSRCMVLDLDSRRLKIK
jgi:hypothetical protein